MHFVTFSLKHTVSFNISCELFQVCIHYQQSLMKNQELTPTSLFLSILIFHSACFCVTHVFSCLFNKLHLYNNVTQISAGGLLLVWKGDFVTFEIMYKLPTALYKKHYNSTYHGDNLRSHYITLNAVIRPCCFRTFVNNMNYFRRFRNYLYTLNSKHNTNFTAVWVRPPQLAWRHFNYVAK